MRRAASLLVAAGAAMASAEPRPVPPSAGADARTLWTAGRDRELALDLDSAIVLVRAAIRADPSYMPAHASYVELSGRRGDFSSVAREYREWPERTPLIECMTAVTSAPDGYVAAAVEPLLDVERRYGRSACTATYLAGFMAGFPPERIWKSRTLEYARDAVRLAPEVYHGWRAYALALRERGQNAAAESVLVAAIHNVPHAVDRFTLLHELRLFHLARRDTIGAAEIARRIRTAAARDGALLPLFYTHALWFSQTTDERRRARDLAEQMRLVRTKGAWAYEWHMAVSVGSRRIDEGDPTAALSMLDRAVRIADSAKQLHFAHIARRLRGRAYVKLGRLDDAEQELLTALRIGTSDGEIYSLAETYHNLAHTYEGAGRFEDAARAAAQFVALARKMPLSQPRIMSLRDAGLIDWKAGWHAAANAHLAEMQRAIDRQEKHRYWAGEYLERRGDFAGAMRYYQAAVDANEEDRTLSLAGLSRMLEALGRRDTAAAVAREHDRMVAAGSPSQIDSPLLPRLLARSTNDSVRREAILVERRWLEQRLRAGNVQGAAIAAIDLAQLLLDTRQPAEAAAAAAVADSLARANNLTEQLLAAGRIRGLAAMAAGDSATGLAQLRRTVALADAHPTMRASLDARLALAQGLAGGGEATEALAAFDRAALLVDRVTSALPNDVDRAAFRSLNLAAHDGALRMLLTKDSAPASRMEQIATWSQRRKSAALTLPFTTRLAPLSLAELRSRLAANEAFLDYLAVGDGWYALVARRSGAALVRLPADTGRVRGWIARIRKPIAHTGEDRLDAVRARFDLDAAHELYRGLLAPLDTLLTGVKRLVVSNDGEMSRLPLEVLVIEPPGRTGTTGTTATTATTAARARPFAAYERAQFVVDRYDVSYVPSAQFISPAHGGRRLSRAARTLVVSSAAPGAAAEVDGIRRAWRARGVTVLSGDSATEEAVRAREQGRDILHFATHATASDEDPLASFLRLAPDAHDDGFLHLSEIATLRGAPALVVLSACETLDGPLYPGEGLIGIARAFLAAGSRSVVAASWPVGEATAQLMTTFHERLAAGDDEASALRTAKLAVRRNPATAHPFYWGAFVLVSRE